MYIITPPLAIARAAQCIGAVIGLSACLSVCLSVAKMQKNAIFSKLSNRASARADTQMTHRKESNTESGHNTKWLITANGLLQS